MRSRRGSAFVVVAAFLALVGAAQSAAGPSTVTSGYTVGAMAVPGASTGLVLAGDSVTVSATGTVCPWTGSCFGPDGDAFVDTTQSGFGGFVAPGAPAWGLVARVGGGAWVQVGSGPTTLSGTGELVFAVTDDRQCWPGRGWGDANHDHCGPPGLVGSSTENEGAASTGDASANGRSHGGQGKGNGIAKGQ